MTEESMKTFDFAADIAKQMVTLSTGIVTITLLFSKEIAYGRAWAVAAWIVFLFSTLAGLWTLMALTGTLLRIAEKDHPFKIASNVLVPARLQVITFIFGIILTMGFVISSSAHRTTQTRTNDCCCTCKP